MSAENTTFILAAIIIALAISTTTFIENFFNEKIAVAGFQAGLQQCKVNNEIIWSKECPK